MYITYVSAIVSAIESKCNLTGITVVGKGGVAVTSNCNELVPHRTLVVEHEVTSDSTEDVESNVTVDVWVSSFEAVALSDDSRVVPLCGG